MGTYLKECILYFILLVFSLPLSSQCTLPDPLIWLRADQGFSSSTWSDQSGNSRDGSNTGNPTLVNDCLNFNPAVQFDGDDESACSAPELVFSSGNHHINIFCVYIPDVSGSDYGVFGNQANGGVNNMMLFDGIIGDGNGSAPNYSVPNLFNTNPHLMSYVMDEEDNVSGTLTSSYLYDLGIQEAVFTYNENVSSKVGNDIYVGSSGQGTVKKFFTGKIAEFIVYEENNGSTSLTEAQRQQVQSYLAVKYGFTLLHDYIDLQGNIIKSVDGPFAEGIAAIGIEEQLDLYQLKSKSVGDKYSLCISSNNLSNGSYIFLSHNDEKEEIFENLFYMNTPFTATERTWKIESNYNPIDLFLEISSDDQFEYVIISEDPDFNSFTAITYSDGIELKNDNALYLKLAVKSKALNTASNDVSALPY